MRVRLFVVPALLVAGGAARARAQISVDARLGGARDALAWDDAAEDRLAAAGSLDAEYRFAAGRAALSYALDAATYSTPGDWSTLRNDLVGTYRTDLGASGRVRILFDAGATWTRNGDAWAAAGYRALGGGVGAEYRPSGGVTLRVGYGVAARDVSGVPELDQVEQGGFVGALVNLQTRTTLVGEIRLGGKSYAGAWLPVEPASPPVSGRGHASRGMGPTLRPPRLTAVRDGEHAGRVDWHVRLAQSLADRTGLSVQYSARHTFGEVPPVLVTTPAHFFDDGVYDDPFASDARGVMATLKQVFEGAGVVQTWFGWQRRDYRATPALDLDGRARPDGALREDRLWRAGARWNVPLFPERTGPWALDLDLGYAFTRHRSSDAFYNYTSHAVTLALSIAY